MCVRFPSYCCSIFLSCQSKFNVLLHDWMDMLGGMCVFTIQSRSSFYNMLCNVVLFGGYCFGLFT